ncbi:hypothetical protein LINPERPRIM_LOCUS36682 [Linum perenne]
MESIADDHRKEITPQGKNRGSRSPVPDLLEEAWFFRKLIDGTTAAAVTKKKPAVRSMGRCLSDLTSTQTVSLPPSPPLPPTPPGGLPRAPSLPPSGGCCRKSSRRNRGGDERKRVSRSERSSPGSDGDGGVWGGRNPGSLERAPSLPPWIGREEAEEVVDDESDMSMSWLIQQAMSCSLDDISIPKSTAASPKVSRITHSSSMNSETRDGTSNRRRIPESNDRFNFNNINNNNNQSTVINNNNSNRNAVPGRRLNKTLSNIEIPRQQKQNAAAAYSYYYQSRRPNSDRSSPSIPPWASTANETDDIKAHLKVWARSVAANIN